MVVSTPRQRSLCFFVTNSMLVEKPIFPSWGEAPCSFDIPPAPSTSHNDLSFVRPPRASPNLILTASMLPMLFGRRVLRCHVPLKITNVLNILRRPRALESKHPSQHPISRSHPLRAAPKPSQCARTPYCLPIFRPSLGPRFEQEFGLQQPSAYRSSSEF